MTDFKHLFVMDSPENLNMKLDSSLRMAQALLKRGHRCAITTPSELSWYSNNKEKVRASACWLSLTDEPTPRIEEKTLVEATDFHAIHMRKDPPFDSHYISCTWILSYLEKSAKIYNAPRSLRSLNEKLSIYDFPQYSRAALLSAETDTIAEFIRENCEGDAIVKPLDLYGGRGVERINTSEIDPTKLKQIIRQHTKNATEQRLFQPFDKAIFEGEVRAFTAAGETISWSLKVPADGEYLANTRSGAVVQPYKPTSEEISMVQEISQDLLKRGIFLVGYDLIGGYVSEINITSPRLLVEEGRDVNPLYARVAELIEMDLVQKK